jgi:alpha/beta superfamily hydrolase
MATQKWFSGFSFGVIALMLTACATQPAESPAQSSSNPAPPAAATSSPPAPNSAAAENDTAAAMEKRFQDAARGYKVVQKDGKTLYCKREKQIGTTIPTMNCMTESQLRHQVETMEEYRNRARNSSRCTHGVGCGAGS